LRRRLRTAGVVKVHKLLYYCQGWHLAWFGEPLFEEDVNAWLNGPVVADLWHDEDKERSLPARRELDSAMLNTVEYVVSRYGSLTGKQLIRLTHEEAPWRTLSEQESTFTGDVISHEQLKAFFESDGDDETSSSVFANAMTDPGYRKLVEAAVMREEPPSPDEPEEVVARLRYLAG
jgi:uncharacterized phage-associated protein